MKDDVVHAMTADGVVEVWCHPFLNKALDEGWQTDGTRDQRDTRKDFLGKQHHCCPNFFFYLFCPSKLRDLSPRANYTDRAAAAGRRS